MILYCEWEPEPFLALTRISESSAEHICTSFQLPFGEAVLSSNFQLRKKNLLAYALARKIMRMLEYLIVEFQ